jgi:hypothetical protein
LKPTAKFQLGWYRLPQKFDLYCVRDSVLLHEITVGRHDAEISPYLATQTVDEAKAQVREMFLRLQRFIEGLPESYSNVYFIYDVDRSKHPDRSSADPSRDMADWLEANAFDQVMFEARLYPLTLYRLR